VKADKVLSLLGLAQRAGNVASGEFMTEKSVKSKKARLVIVAEDASQNTQKMFANMCEFHKVPLYLYASKEELGHAIGKQYRASVAVTESGFAKSLENRLKVILEKRNHGGSKYGESQSI
jgi:ribosomal protein L7Ae-like RNA K-turn-binding protein